MKYLIKPENGIWVASKESEESIEDIIKGFKEKVFNVQAWFFDLDDNHAPAPAKIIAQKAIGTNYCNINYLKWCIEAAIFKTLTGKSSESKLWEQYVNKFLRTENSLEEVKNLFSEEKARNSLYEGVEELCFMLSDAKRFYISRNIKEVLEVYSRVLGFDGFFSEARSKGSIIEQFVKQNSLIDNFGVEGDSSEDGETIDVLKFYNKKVVSIYTMDKPIEKKFDERFDYATSKNRCGLVDLLKS